MEEYNSILIIFALSGMGLIYGLYNVICVLSITVAPCSGTDGEKGEKNELTLEQCHKLEEISNQISSGSRVFLLREYFYMVIFIILFGTIIFFTSEHKKGQPFTTVAFVVGALTSILCGFIGMMIATSSNYRTTYKAL